MQITDIEKKIEPILRQHKVQRASVFGSVARGAEHPGSDIDLLVRFERPLSMIAYVRFVEQIEKALEHPVDVITEQGVSKHIKPHIEADLKTIYESR